MERLVERRKDRQGDALTPENPQLLFAIGGFFRRGQTNFIFSSEK
jgi:hypothetical protein